MVELLRAGLVEYEPAWRWQQRRASAIRAGTATEAVALLEHPPVFTLGRRARREHLLTDEAELRARGAAVIAIDRGGDITFHGPGQLVCYPLLDLRARQLGAGDYVRALEAALLATLRRFDVRGERVAGRPGVWVRGSKVAAIGVRVRAGVSTHGLALNIATDLRWFEHIIPCGIADAGVTSLQRLLSAAPSMAEVETTLAEELAAALDLALVAVPPTELAGPLGQDAAAEPVTMGASHGH